MMKFAKQKVSTTDLLIAAVVDRLNVAICGKKAPKSLVEQLTANTAEKKNNVASFDSSEAFEKMREKLLKGE